MKAISLWEPWATFMAISAKLNETRSWPAAYRGDLVICATKFVPPLSDICAERIDQFRDIIRPDIKGQDTTYEKFISPGMALCVVELYGCVPTGEFHRAVPMNITQVETDLGNYSEGRFAWLTRNCRRFKNPFPVKGRQGFFDIPDEVVKEALL